MVAVTSTDDFDFLIASPAEEAVEQAREARTRRMLEQECATTIPDYKYHIATFALMRARFEVYLARAEAMQEALQDPKKTSDEATRIAERAARHKAKDINLQELEAQHKESIANARAPEGRE